MSLLDYKTLLFPIQEFEKYVVNPDAESDFSGSNIDPCPDVSQEGSSKNELYAQVPLHVEDNKVSEDEGVSDPYEHVFDYPLGMSNSANVVADALSRKVVADVGLIIIQARPM